MLKKRIELGVSSQVDLERIKLELGSINQALISLQFKQAQQIKKIALSLGMSQEKFNLIPINVSKIKELINAATIAFLDNQTISELKSKTIISNKTLRVMLANYAIKESKLKYEIAKQYPDFDFSPAYFYDLGDNIWSIGIDSVFNASKKNKLFIEKAKKIRSLEAGKLKTYQLSLINDSELLLFNFHNHLKTLKNTQRILEDKNNLKKQLQNRFNQGILDRLELELEIIKLNQFDKDYHKALYNLLRSGLDAEKIMQRPIFTNKLPI
jgi:cobalt-zinc-cadmium efflux system outer membrane protein